MKTARRTLSYRKAQYPTSSSKKYKTLQEYVIKAHQKISTVPHRQVTSANGTTLQCMYSRQRSGLLRLHIAEYSPNQNTSGVPNAKAGAEESILSTIDAPKDEDYLVGDVKAVICGDDLVLCRTQSHESILGSYLHDIFTEAKIAKESRRFRITRPVNVKILNEIGKHGVHKLDLGVSAHLATVDLLNRKYTRQMLGGALWDTVKAFCQNLDRSMADIRGDENIRGTVTLWKDKRGKADYGADRINALATTLAEESPEDIKLVLNNGDKYSGNSMTLSTTAELRKSGITVDRSSAFSALTEYFDELRTNGYTEQ